MNIFGIKSIGNRRIGFGNKKERIYQNRKMPMTFDRLHGANLEVVKSEIVFKVFENVFDRKAAGVFFEQEIRWLENII